jgi:hypothetical protein
MTPVASRAAAWRLSGPGAGRGFGQGGLGAGEFAFEVGALADFLLQRLVDLREVFG